MSSRLGKMPHRVPVAQLRHGQLPALRRGAGPFQLSRCESRVLQYFELRQQLVGTVELAGFKRSPYGIFDLGDVRRVIRVWRSPSEGVLVASSNLNKLSSQLLGRHIFFAEGCEKCLQRVPVDPSLFLRSSIVCFCWSDKFPQSFVAASMMPGNCSGGPPVMLTGPLQSRPTATPPGLLALS